MVPFGCIAEIWRYPVSSVGGERISSANVTPAGVAGDRKYGLVDAESGLPAVPEKDHRWRKALHLEANFIDGPTPKILFPDGSSFLVDDRSLNDALSDYFGFAAAIAAYEHVEATSTFPLTHYRHQHFPMHLLTTTSLDHLAKLQEVETVDRRRFRPTVLIAVSKSEGFVEDEWIGRQLRLGTIDLTVREKTKRCGMTFISQPGIAEDPAILRNILRHNKRHLGIYCSIDSLGGLRVGDQLFI